MPSLSSLSVCPSRDSREPLYFYFPQKNAFKKNKSGYEKREICNQANLPKHYGSLLSQIAQGKNPVAKLAQKARQMSKTSAWLLASSIPSNARNGEMTANGAVRRLSNNLQLFLINTLGLIIPSFARFLAFIFFLKLNHSKIFSLFLQKTQRVVKLISI
jgi:hypothetical protein